MGIATIIPNPNQSHEKLIKYADKALYQAKDGGRDMFIISDVSPSIVLP